MRTRAGPQPDAQLRIEGLNLSDQQARFALDQVDQATAQAQDIAYEATPDGSLQRRLIEHVRTLYRRNDLSGALPLGQIESLALPFEPTHLSLRPACWPKCSETASPTRCSPRAAMCTASPTPTGGCPRPQFSSPNAGDTPEQELAFARQHFFVPQRLQDPFGNIATVSYDVQDLLPIATRDPLDNAVQVVNDYRVLQPRLVTDPNGNRSEAAFDTLGMVVGIGVMGKADQALGDSLEGFTADVDEETIAAHLQAPLTDPHSLLQGATTRLVYDLFAYQRTQAVAQPQPAVIYNLARETHLSDLGTDESTRCSTASRIPTASVARSRRRSRPSPGRSKSMGHRSIPRSAAAGPSSTRQAGAAVRALLHRHARLRVRSTARRQPHPVL